MEGLIIEVWRICFRERREIHRGSISELGIERTKNLNVKETEAYINVLFYTTSNNRYGAKLPTSWSSVRVINS